MEEGSYLLRAGVVGKQQKKKFCQTRCKIGGPGKEDRIGEGTGTGKDSSLCGTSSHAIDL